MNIIRFSIIIPVYNVGELIKSAINSIINQSYMNYELILIDNASTDNTSNIIAEFKEYDNINIIRLDINRGSGGARNVGIQNACGEYILFLDSDDIFYGNDIFSKIDKIIGQDEPDIVYFGYQEVGGENNLYLPTAKNSTKEARLIYDITNAVWSKCWRLKFLFEADLFFKENMYYEDMPFSYKANIMSKKNKYGSFPIVKYTRRRSGSVMATASVQKCSDLYRYMACIMDLYLETPKEYRKYLIDFIDSENVKMSARVHRIVEAIENGSDVSIQPKRG